MILIRLIAAGIQETEAITCVKNELGIDLSENGMPVNLKRTDTENYALKAELKDSAAAIEYCDIPALLRALRLVIGALTEGKNTFSAEEKRCFKTCGAMFDCSRNAVINIDTAKYFLRRMAVMGLNTFMLYTEDTYEVAGEPYFGYMRGRYSLDELREIDDYAYSLGVELIPCIQTLAHMEQFLKWQAANVYRDTDEVLMTDSEETYVFIEKLLRSVSSAVRTKKIHIGMDEAHTLGLGQHLDKFGYHTRIELMQKHIVRVKEITDKLGLKPMMWGDMLFRLHINGGGYYDSDVQLPDDAGRLITEGIGQIYWDYYHLDEDFYHLYIGWHKKFGNLPIFGGGICTWIGSMVQNYNHTKKATNAAMRACKSEGIEDVFTCIWNDNGGECNYLSVLPGLVRYAEHMYTQLPQEAQMEERIKLFTGLDDKAWTALCALDCLDESFAPLEPQNPSKYLLWQDPLLGLFDRNCAHLEMEDYYAGLILGMRQYTDGTLPEEYRGIFDQIIGLCSVLQIKARLGVRIKAAYDAKNTEALENIVNNVLPELIEKVEALHVMHESEWFKIYKSFGWEVIDLRYGGLLTRLKFAVRRIKAYLDGKIDCIEELEPERLSFDGREKIEDKWIGHFNKYHLMVTPNCLG